MVRIARGFLDGFVSSPADAPGTAIEDADQTRAITQDPASNVVLLMVRPEKHGGDAMFSCKGKSRSLDHY